MVVAFWALGPLETLTLLALCVLLGVLLFGRHLGQAVLEFKHGLDRNEGTQPMSDLRVTQVDHVSVLVTDLERSRLFYRDLLGLREIAKPRTFDFRVLWFQLGDTQLHLLWKERPDTVSPRHFALRVESCAAAREYCRARGIALQETTPIPGADRFFVADPDGNRIEIIEWLTPFDPAASGAAELDR